MLLRVWLQVAILVMVAVSKMLPYGVIFFSKLCKAGLRSIQKACCFKNPGVSGGKDNYDADGEHGNDTAAAEDLGQLLISRVKAVEHDRAKLGGSDILKEKAEQTAGNDAGCHRQPDIDCDR